MLNLRSLRNLALYFALALALSLNVIATAAERPPERPPNLIYIMCDDLGYGDLGSFGQKVIQTPHLDRLAAGGMRFTDFYSGATVCRPSRLVLWTGFHSGHTAINSNQGYVLKPSDVTVAERLKRAGYATGGVGKWALGDVTNPGHPNKQGFDFWMGYLSQSNAHNYYPTHLWRNMEEFPLKGNVLMDHPAARGRVADPKHRVTYSHDVMTEQAFDFIRKHQDKPFLLHIHWTIPHTNNEGGRVTGDGQEVPDYGIYKDKDWPNPEKGQAAMITRMDGDVGRLVKLLKDLKIEKDTLIVFTSDNGPHQEGGHKMEYFDANGPLRGMKRDLYEGGIRVPMIAYWPGKIKPGTVSDHPSAFWDWTPTACELAGLDIPKDTDGISFVNAMLGKKQQKHDYLFWAYGPKTAVRQGHWKAVQVAKNKPWELYDLRTDIGEKNDLAKAHPDVVAKMKQLAETARSK